MDKHNEIATEIGNYIHFSIQSFKQNDSVGADQFLRFAVELMPLCFPREKFPSKNLILKVFGESLRVINSVNWRESSGSSESFESTSSGWELDESTVSPVKFSGQDRPKSPRSPRRVPSLDQVSAHCWESIELLCSDNKYILSELCECFAFIVILSSDISYCLSTMPCRHQDLRDKITVWIARISR